MSYKVGDKVIVVGAGSYDIPKGSILDVVVKCSKAGQWICGTDVQVSSINSTDGRGGIYQLAPYNPRPLEDVVTRLKAIDVEVAKLEAESEQLHRVLYVAGLQLVA